jgi:hypothetical protein
LPRGGQLDDEHWYKLASAAALGRLSRVVTVNAAINTVVKDPPHDGIKGGNNMLPWAIGTLIILALAAYAMNKVRRVTA